MSWGDALYKSCKNHPTVVYIAQFLSGKIQEVKAPSSSSGFEALLNLPCDEWMLKVGPGLDIELLNGVLDFYQIHYCKVYT